MSFLHLAMLAGTLAVAVPILIHLFWRRRPRTVGWGAMFLIEQVVRDTSRRIAFEQRALLALRCLIMLVLALALARPVVTGCRPLTGSSPVSLALVVDNSPSMDAVHRGNQTLLEEARSRAVQLIDDLPDGSRVHLVSGGTTSQERLTPEEAADRIADLPSDATPFSLDAALMQAQASLEADSNPQRQIVVLGDFQPNSMPENNSPRRSPSNVSIDLLPIAPERSANLAISSVAVSPRRPEPSQTVRIIVRIRNYGPLPSRALPVRLEVEDQPQQEQQVDVPPDGEAIVTFLHTATEAGPLRAQLTIDPSYAADVLEADDTYLLALHVAPPPRILLVDGSDGTLPFGQNPADFLELALSSERSADEEPVLSVVGTEGISAASLDDVAVVVLANVASLADGQVTQLRSFVEAGGAVMVWAGEAIDLPWYNGWDLLPAAVTDLNVRSEPASPQGPPYAHPALNLWREDNAALSQIEVRTHYTLVPKETAATVLRLEDGTPLIVEHGVGSGSVSLAGIPATPGWSDLPLRPAFLPLVRQLVDHAVARATLPRTLVAGQSLALRATPEQAQTFHLITPAGEPAALSQTLVSGTTLLQSHLRTTPGFYQVTDGGGQPYAVYAVNLDRQESDIRRPPDSRLQVLAQLWNARLVTSIDELITRDHQRRYGNELARPLLIALAGLLVLEPFFSAILARLRTARLPPMDTPAREAA